MRFHGTEGQRSGSGSRRANLPRGVRPDTEYRDVEIDYALASRLEEPPEELLTGGRDEHDPPGEGQGTGKPAKADTRESDEED
ncbi:hypothetical protein [Streptomyces sulphureus]|uniref:hypothetical protein n=1 Tax=Streptomyces sulphureus TaxID=47758 RepID=UPI000367CA5E|nr:hypothetical protein [Streptomyces sulphureus]